MSYRAIVPVVVIIALLTACTASPSGQAAGSSSDGSMSGMPGMGGSAAYAFGMPADLMSVDRTVDVRLLDDPRFQPSSIDVDTGESVRFDVINDGQTVHEFVLGDRAYQDDHEMSMGQMSGAMPADEPNALVLQPGETRSLAWTFTDAGPVLYGCHFEGHYAAGMVGTIMVRG